MVERFNIRNTGVSCKLLEGAEGGTGGERIFYDHETKEDILTCPSYKIDKYLVKPYFTQEWLDKIILGRKHKIFISTDGPLLLIFKVKGSIFIQTMKDCETKTFGDKFSQTFAQTYGYGVEQLFNKDVETSKFCYIYRFGEGALSTDGTGIRKLVQCGTMLCKKNASYSLRPHIIEQEEEINEELVWNTSIVNLSYVRRELGLTDQNFVNIGIIGDDGSSVQECQIFTKEYLKRIGAITGRKPSSLAGREIPKGDHDFTEPIKITLSKFPPILDILSLYVLCGVNARGDGLVTTRGYELRDNHVAPMTGFYNYCAAADVRCRDVIPFGPSIWEMREAVKKIFLGGVVKSDFFPARWNEVEKLVKEDLVQLVTELLKPGNEKMLETVNKHFKISIIHHREPLNIIADIDPYKILTLVRWGKRFDFSLEKLEGETSKIEERFSTITTSPADEEEQPSEREEK